MKYYFDKAFQKMMTDHGLKQVLILGHIIADGDAAGSVMAVAHYIRAVFPEYQVFPYLADDMYSGPKRMVMSDKVFTPFQKSAPDRHDKYAVIVCDTPTVRRMAGYEYFRKATATMVIDHHVSNEFYADINFVEESKACALNVYQMLDWERWSRAKDSEKGIHPNAQDYIYLGLVHDTDSFRKTTAEIFMTAAELIRNGVDHQMVMDTYYSDSIGNLKKKAILHNMVRRGQDGSLAYIYIDHELSKLYEISYDDFHNVSRVLMDCRDIAYSLTMMEKTPGTWKCSLRSNGKTLNCNQILSAFGGGGHAHSAGLLIQSQHPTELRDQIISVIRQAVGPGSIK